LGEEVVADDFFDFSFLDPETQNALPVFFFRKQDYFFNGEVLTEHALIVLKQASNTEVSVDGRRNFKQCIELEIALFDLVVEPLIIHSVIASKVLQSELHHGCGQLADKRQLAILAPRLFCGATEIGFSSCDVFGNTALAENNCALTNNHIASNTHLAPENGFVFDCDTACNADLSGKQAFFSDGRVVTNVHLVVYFSCSAYECCA
jgi:hypothetical protein